MRLQAAKTYLPMAIVILLTLMLMALVVLYFALSGEVAGFGELVLGLSPDFEKYEAADTYDAAYTDGEVIVGVLRLSYDACAAEGIPTTMPPRAFAEYYRTLALSGITAGETRSVGDAVYYTYTATSSLGVSFTYMPTFYFSPYAYFVVTYIVPTERFPAREAELLSYAEGTKIQPSRVE